MKYKKPKYGDTASVFTQTVDNLVKEQLSEFEAQFKTLVTEEFTKAAFEHATAAVRKSLNLR